jgi:hypothetical protein
VAAVGQKYRHDRVKAGVLGTEHYTIPIDCAWTTRSECVLGTYKKYHRSRLGRESVPDNEWIKPSEPIAFQSILRLRRAAPQGWSIRSQGRYGELNFVGSLFPSPLPYYELN